MKLKLSEETLCSIDCELIAVFEDDVFAEILLKEANPGFSNGYAFSILGSEKYWAAKDLLLCYGEGNYHIADAKTLSFPEKKHKTLIKNFTGQPEWTLKDSLDSVGEFELGDLVADNKRHVGRIVHISPSGSNTGKLYLDYNIRIQSFDDNGRPSSYVTMSYNLINKLSYVKERFLQYD